MAVEQVGKLAAFTGALKGAHATMSDEEKGSERKRPDVPEIAGNKDGMLRPVTNLLRAAATVVDWVPLFGADDVAAAVVEGVAGLLDSAECALKGDLKGAGKEFAVGAARAGMAAIPMVEYADAVTGIAKGQTAKGVVGDLIAESYDVQVHNYEQRQLAKAQGQGVQVAQAQSISPELQQQQTVQVAQSQQQGVITDKAALIAEMKGDQEFAKLHTQLASDPTIQDRGQAKGEAHVQSSPNANAGKKTEISHG